MSDMLRSKTTKRTNRVVSRLSDEELSLLDSVRGGRCRGSAFRLLALDSLPRSIPAINIKLHSDLGRALGNLSSIATISRQGGFVLESELLPILREVRTLLLSAKTHLTDDEAGE